MCLHTCTGQCRAGSEEGAGGDAEAQNAGLKSSLQTRTASAGYLGCSMTLVVRSLMTVSGAGKSSALL